MSEPTKTLLVIHHTVSPALEALLEAVLAGARTDGIEGVAVVAKAALATTASDVLAADAYVLGTPANMGYMSGALKHVFDQVYYPCRLDTRGRGYGLYVHGNLDVEGAIRSVSSLATGMGWERRHDDVPVRDTPSADDLEACLDLGGTLAAGLMPG